MVLALLVVLNTSSLCVAHTDVCAPKGSTLTGTLHQSGGQITITPSQPFRALGAEFRARTNVVVTVLPWWSSDKTSGAVVHVAGELTKETQISGARVAGTVRIGQMQGTRSTPPQLVEATDMRGGQLTVGAGGTVAVTPGMRINGGVDIDRVRLDVTSAQPIRAFGIDLAAGTVRVEHHSAGITLGGTLVTAQDIRGVLVEKDVYVTIEKGVPRFGTANLARATPLKAFGLPDGTAPAGTIVRSTYASTQLVGPGPFKVCGLSLAPAPTLGQPALTFTPFGPTYVAVNGALARADTDVGGGLHMTGTIALRYAPGGCQRLSIEGTLARPTTQGGLPFAANKAFTSGIFSQGGVPLIRGTLATPTVVDGFTVKGEVMVHVPTAGELQLVNGTLAKSARFEQWQLPAGSQVDRVETTSWSFTVPGKQSARALAEHRGERIDAVAEARSDQSSTWFMLRRPHTPKGTTLAFRSLGIQHHDGCILGDVASPQRFGIFKIPKGGTATICGGVLTAAQSTYAFPALQVGPWFATQAVAGDPAKPPVKNDDSIEVPPPSGSTPSATPAPGSAPGYWIQINSLCQGMAGIPLPPPEERWIWVDLKGVARSAADRKELAARAAKAGTPCPVQRCCPP